MSVCVLFFETEVSTLGVKSSVFGKPPGFEGGETGYRKTRGKSLEASGCCLWGEMGGQVGKKEELLVEGGNFEGLFLYETCTETTSGK